MTTGTNSSTVAAATAGGLGCLAIPIGGTVVISSVMIVGGLSVLLFPLVIIFMIFHGLSLSGLGNVGDPGSGLTVAEQSCEAAERQQTQSDPNGTSKRAAAIITGDGRGKLEVTPPDSVVGGGIPCTVPEELFNAIEDAGGICDAIGPVVIAAQIEYESGFDSKFVGPNGAKGISQVPPDAFSRMEGADADPFDPKKSIDAQGKFLCELSDQVQDLLNHHEVAGNTLDLTLTAYDVGIDAVREAKGVPATNDSQSYITGVRTWFASMEGIGPVPRKLAGVPALHDDDGAELAS